METTGIGQSSTLGHKVINADQPSANRSVQVVSLPDPESRPVSNPGFPSSISDIKDLDALADRYHHILEDSEAVSFDDPGIRKASDEFAAVDDTKLLAFCTYWAKRYPADISKISRALELMVRPASSKTVVGGINLDKAFCVVSQDISHSLEAGKEMTSLYNFRETDDNGINRALDPYVSNNGLKAEANIYSGLRALHYSLKDAVSIRSILMAFGMDVEKNNATDQGNSDVAVAKHAFLSSLASILIEDPSYFDEGRTVIDDMMSLGWYMNSDLNIPNELYNAVSGMLNKFRANPQLAQDVLSKMVLLSDENNETSSVIDDMCALGVYMNEDVPNDFSGSVADLLNLFKKHPEFASDYFPQVSEKNFDIGSSA